MTKEARLGYSFLEVVGLIGSGKIPDFLVRNWQRIHQEGVLEGHLLACLMVATFGGVGLGVILLGAIEAIVWPCVVALIPLAMCFLPARMVWEYARRPMNFGYDLGRFFDLLGHDPQNDNPLSLRICMHELNGRLCELAKEVVFLQHAERQSISNLAEGRRAVEAHNKFRELFKLSQETFRLYPPETNWDGFFQFAGDELEKARAKAKKAGIPIPMEYGGTPVEATGVPSIGEQVDIIA